MVWSSRSIWDCGRIVARPHPDSYASGRKRSCQWRRQPAQGPQGEGRGGPHFGGSPGSTEDQDPKGGCGALALKTPLLWKLDEKLQSGIFRFLLAA